MGTHPRLPGLTADREPGEAMPLVLAADAGASRRAFLTKVAIGGAALTVGSQLVPATRLLPTSGAQEGGEALALDEDETRMEFLASIALAASEAYRAAAARTTDPLPEPVAEVVAAFGQHHSQQATTFLGLLPEGYDIESLAPNATLLAEQTSALDGADGAEAVLGALRSLEESLAATHFVALGALESQDDARVVATALPVCAQHATVLGVLEGRAPADVLPEAQTGEGALALADHPVTGGTEGGAEGGQDSTTTTANDGGDGPDANGEGGTGQTGEGTDTGGGGATDEGGTGGGDSGQGQGGQGQGGAGSDETTEG
ncbi:MAG TPA: twin-arginine translocation signal domain-containing protein [Acidimicrobiales bacterium]|nr:twin-arginine translocation signal domain-containing protein [Acidimicrobiales bacterium]